MLFSVLRLLVFLRFTVFAMSLFFIAQVLFEQCLRIGNFNCAIIQLILVTALNAQVVIVVYKRLLV